MKRQLQDLSVLGRKRLTFNRTDEIVKKFYEFSDVQQVKVNELVKNPFKHEIFLGNLKKKSDTEKRNFDINAEIMRQQRLKTTSKEYTAFEHKRRLFVKREL